MTGLNNVVLPTLFIVVNNIEQILNSIVEPESGVTMLFNVVNNFEQCGQHNILQSCFQQHCNRLMIFCRVQQRKNKRGKNVLSYTSQTSKKGGISGPEERFLSQLVHKVVEECSEFSQYNIHD